MDLITHASPTAKAEGGKRRENTRTNWYFLLSHRFLKGMMESHLQAAGNVNVTEQKTHTANAMNPLTMGSLCGQLLHRDLSHNHLASVGSYSQRECSRCWDKAL